MTELDEVLKRAGIRREDVVEQFVRSGGHGGQNVNKTSTCVYLKHIPSGTAVKCSQERSQAANRSRAWDLLVKKIEVGRRAHERTRLMLIEKLKRRSRRRPEYLKERILQGKRKNAEKKKLRSCKSWQCDIIT